MEDLLRSLAILLSVRPWLIVVAIVALFVFVLRLFFRRRPKQIPKSDSAPPTRITNAPSPTGVTALPPKPTSARPPVFGNAAPPTSAAPQKPLPAPPPPPSASVPSIPKSSGYVGHESDSSSLTRSGVAWQDYDATLVRVFYATDRLRVPGTIDNAEYDWQRSPEGRLDYGECQVSIPDVHVTGQLESPSLLRFEFRPEQAHRSGEDHES
jgi:hypothetical protein